MAKIVGKTLGWVGYTTGTGTNNWAADNDANLRKIDALLQAGAVAIQNAPPGSPVEGQVYVVGTSPTGAWASQANAIARWNGSAAPSGAWEFFAPAAGWWIAVGAQDYRFSGSAWVAGWTPAHGPSHHLGGSDPLDGQSIPGLLPTSSPTFASIQLKGPSTNTDVGFLNTSGVLRYIFRADDSGDKLYVVTRNDDGSSRAERFRIERSSSLPVWVSFGLNVSSGALQMGGVDSILATREGRFTGMRLSNLTSGQMPVASDANGQITASGETDDGTYFTTSRVFRSWNTLTKTGNVWTALQWTQAAEERVALFSSDASGVDAKPVIMLAHNDAEAASRTLGIIGFAQKVVGKTGSNPGVKADMLATTVGSGGTNGGYGGKWTWRYRPDNGAALVEALRVGAFGGSTPDAVEAAILLRANAGFLTGLATFQDASASQPGIDFISDAGSDQAHIRILNSATGNLLGGGVGDVEFSFTERLIIGNNLSQKIIFPSGADPIVIEKLKATKGLYGGISPRTASEATAGGDVTVSYTGSGGHTESLPAAIGSGRIIFFANAGSGTWTLSASGSDVIHDGGTSPVTSIAIQAAAQIRSRILQDVGSGIWMRLN